MPATFTRRAAALLVTFALAGAYSGWTAATAEAKPAYVQVTATGSSWAGNAVSQWVADVATQGMRVVFTANGSAQGRKDFASYNDDFAVSDIGYQGTDPLSGLADSSSRAYAYLPIVAGGTAFPYHVTYAGKRVTNLRLSGKTLAMIFTGQIKTWNDPQIKSDNNNNINLPNEVIVPVVHSEGAGSTAQFTQYLASQYGSIWSAFAGSSKFTEYYPAKNSMRAQNGSDGVMNFIASSAGEGTIGFDEYSYALQAGYPVAKIENAAGYFTLPTQYNDAVALTKAQINSDPTSPNYLLQDLSQVYTNSDPRTYPLSSYSYAIIPTDAKDKTMTSSKRQTIADYLKWAVCNGQGEVGKIGYSSLPLNLVQASFSQIAKLNAADSAVDISAQTPQSCSNPTFDPTNLSLNKLAEIDPQPAACDQSGQGPCGDDTSTGSANSAPKASTSSGSGNKSSGSTSSTSGSNSSTGKTNTTGTTASVAASASASSGIDAQALAAAANGDGGSGEGSGEGSSDGGGNSNVPNPTTLASDSRTGSALPYAVLAGVLLVLVLVAPPLVAASMSRSRGSR